jgi:NAD(P)H-flavin reductase
MQTDATPMANTTPNSTMYAEKPQRTVNFPY